jgi:hypothetical protein
MDDLRQYMKNGGSYHFGVELLKKYSPAHPLVQMLSRRNNGFNARKLNQALKEISKLPENNAPQIQKTRYSIEDVAKWPEDIQSLHSQIKEFYSKTGALQGQMRSLIYTPTGKKRKSINENRTFRICADIMHIDSGIRAKWFEIDYFTKHGIRFQAPEFKDEKQQLVSWLSNILQFTSYCRQKESKNDPTGDMYMHRKKVLAQINEYIVQHA